MNRVTEDGCPRCQASKSCQYRAIEDGCPRCLASGHLGNREPQPDHTQISDVPDMQPPTCLLGSHHVVIPTRTAEFERMRRDSVRATLSPLEPLLVRRSAQESRPPPDRRVRKRRRPGATLPRKGCPDILGRPIAPSPTGRMRKKVFWNRSPCGPTGRGCPGVRQQPEQTHGEQASGGAPARLRCAGWFPPWQTRRPRGCR